LINIFVNDIRYYPARRDIIDYIEVFYNSKRQHSYLGYVSLQEFENWQFLKKVA